MNEVPERIVTWAKGLPSGWLDELSYAMAFLHRSNFYLSNYFYHSMFYQSKNYVRQSNLYKPVVREPLT